MNTGERALSPSMQVAERFVQNTRQKKRLEADLKVIKEQLENDMQAVLGLMEDGQLPESFKLNGATVFTREDIWASPSEGHEALAAALSELGLVEYLPKSVNSQSLSAYVREHKDDDGEFDESLIPETLRAKLKISRTTKAVVTG